MVCVLVKEPSKCHAPAFSLIIYVMVTNLCDLHKPFALLTFITVAEFIASISFFLKLIDEHLAVVGGRSLDGNGKDVDDGDTPHGYSDVEQVSAGASIIASFMQEIVYLNTCSISLKCTPHAMSQQF